MYIVKHLGLILRRGAQQVHKEIYIRERETEQEADDGQLTDHVYIAWPEAGR